MPDSPQDNRPSLLSPRAKTLLDQLQDYSNAVYALIDKGDNSPSAIGRELFRRTISDRSTSGPWPALPINPIILSAFSKSELQDWASAIADDGGNVGPILTAWHLYELASTSLAHPAPKASGLTLTAKSPTEEKERKAVRETLNKLKDGSTTDEIIEQLTSTLDKATPWLRNVAAGWTIHRLATKMTTGRPS